MKHLLKHKFYGKILNFLKYKRHKKIKTFLSFSKKKLDLQSVIQYNLKKRQYILKKPDQFNTKIFSLNNLNKKSKNIENKLENKNKLGNTNGFINWDKKKYKINSFLFNILCQFSRNRTHSILGHDILLRFYTIPYRLSLSHFIGNKLLHSYYTNVNKTHFLSLRKKFLLQAKRSTNDNANKTKEYIDSNKKKLKKEITKNLILNLEKRLDSSLLRLLHFKSLYTKKIVNNWPYGQKQMGFKNTFEKKTKNQLDASNKNYSSGRWRKIKAPWKNYSFLQIKQKIKHGHVRINGKKVTCSHLQLKKNDQIMLKGFISNFLWNKNPITKESDLINKNKKELSQTFFFRNATHFLSDLKNLKSKEFSQLDQQNFDIFYNSFFIKNESNSQTNLCRLTTNYIKNLKIKRFSEIFYITYKNFFLLSNSSFFSKTSFTSFERFNNLKFFFQTIGFNQSIYFLWPLISLLSIHNWNSEIKNSIIRSVTQTHSKYQSLNKLTDNSNRVFNSSLIINQQKNLKHLLNLKNFQMKLNSSSSNSLIVKKSIDDNFLFNSKSHNYLLNNSMLMLKTKSYLNFSWIFNWSKSSFEWSNCYAYLIYGTRQCKWVQLQQQQNKGIFSNKIFNKLNFFELELDFFQLSFRYYKSS
jgi:ribosomal protein S4